MSKRRAAYVISEELFKRSYGIPFDQNLTGVEYDPSRNTIKFYMIGGDLPLTHEGGECIEIQPDESSRRDVQKNFWRYKE